jgi:type IV pilus assembly protein PilM
MANKVLSIEIETHSTKICVVSYKSKNPKVYQTIVLDTPYDCVEDGYIKDINTLSKAISNKLKEAKISVNSVIFTISSSKIANREVLIPQVKPNKIQEIINTNAEDYFPIDIKDYNVSYILLEKVNTKEVKQYRLLVLAAHNNLLTTYVELAESLKLRVESIDYLGNSVYHVLQKQVAHDISMVVQINEQNTLITVLKKEVMELQRIIPYGYDAVLHTLIDHPFYHIDKEAEAFRLLMDKPLINPQFNRGGVQNDIASTENPQEGNLIEPVGEITESLRYLVNNVLRVSDYYSTKNRDVRISTIYLMGMGAKFLGIEQIFSNETGIRTESINTLHGVTFAKNLLAENFSQSDFMSCVGASIAPVGMLPIKYTQNVVNKNNIVSVTVISSMAIFTSIVLLVISNQLIKNAEVEKARLTDTITSMESINTVYSENLSLKEELAAIHQIDADCYSNNEQLVELITELELKLPSNVTVHSFHVTATDLLMDITADSKETAAMTLKQLKTIGFLTNVNTAGISEQVDEYGEVQVKFSVSASYSLPIVIQEEAE